MTSAHQDFFNLWHDLTSVSKNSDGYNYRYTDLEKLLEHVKPFCKKHSFALSQRAEDSDQECYVITELIHKDFGVYKESKKRLPVVPAKDTGKICQNHGIASSYQRRYAIQEILCLASTDNDGVQEAQKKTTKLGGAIYNSSQEHKVLLMKLLELNKMDISHGAKADKAMNGKNFEESFLLYARENGISKPKSFGAGS